MLPSLLCGRGKALMRSIEDELKSSGIKIPTGANDGSLQAKVFTQTQKIATLENKVASLQREVNTLKEEGQNTCRRVSRDFSSTEDKNLDVQNLLNNILGITLPDLTDAQRNKIQCMPDETERKFENDVKKRGFIKAGKTVSLQLPVSQCPFSCPYHTFSGTMGDVQKKLPDGQILIVELKSHPFIKKQLVQLLLEAVAHALPGSRHVASEDVIIKLSPDSVAAPTCPFTSVLLWRTGAVVLNVKLRPGEPLRGSHGFEFLYEEFLGVGWNEVLDRLEATREVSRKREREEVLVCSDDNNLSNATSSPSDAASGGYNWTLLLQEDNASQKIADTVKALMLLASSPKLRSHFCGFLPDVEAVRCDVARGIQSMEENIFFGAAPWRKPRHRDEDPWWQRFFVKNGTLQCFSFKKYTADTQWHSADVPLLALRTQEFGVGDTPTFDEGRRGRKRIFSVGMNSITFPPFLDNAFGAGDLLNRYSMEDCPPPRPFMYCRILKVLEVVNETAEDTPQEGRRNRTASLVSFGAQTNRAPSSRKGYVPFSGNGHSLKK